MGNITQLFRYQGSAATLIDKLAYTYTNTAGYPTNQLQTLTDGSGSSAGAVNGTSTFAGHYDANGNLTADPSKPTGTINIGYNLLNLPQTITGAKTITYTYDAGGQKLRRVSAVTGSTDYISGIEYDAGAVTFIQTEEGRAVPSGSAGYIYDYYLADHLGNTRVTFDSHTTTASQIQKDDYYPFGMDINSIANNPPNNYLYNKKELQGELAEYDYGARFYDPVIGRWNTVDPLAEVSRRHSPYNYVEDNPISGTDPDGMMCDGCHFDFNINHETGQPLDPDYDKHHPGDAPKPDFDLSGSHFAIGSRIGQSFDASGDGDSGGGPGDPPTVTETPTGYMMSVVTITATRTHKNANQGGGTPYYDGLNKVNAIAGSSTILGLTGASVGYLKAGSVSLNWYSSGWGGGSRALIKTAQLSKLAETVGRVGVGIGFVADTYEFANGNISGSHYATNTVMGGIALTPVGFVTIPYFVIDAYYPGGFTAAMHDSAPLYNQMNQPNAAPPQVLMGMQ